MNMHKYNYAKRAEGKDEGTRIRGGIGRNSAWEERKENQEREREPYDHEKLVDASKLKI